MPRNPGAEYYPREERDIKSRGPFGKWPNDDEPKEAPAHAGEVVETDEDALIAKIDADKKKKRSKDKAFSGAREMTKEEVAHMPKLQDSLQAELHQKLHRYFDEGAEHPLEGVDNQEAIVEAAGDQLDEESKLDTPIRPRGNIFNDPTRAQKRYASRSQELTSKKLRQVRKKGTMKK